jgi:hypothetical protein
MNVNLLRFVYAWLVGKWFEAEKLAVRIAPDFMQNKRGVTMLAIALVVGLVALGLIIPIGMWASSLVFGVIDDLDLGTAGNATRTTLEANVWSAYDLATILPIIAVAGVIITAVIGIVAWRKGSL